MEIKLPRQLQKNLQAVGEQIRLARLRRDLSILGSLSQTEA
jgi:hypothetical protein